MTLGEIIKNFRFSSEEEMSIRRFASLCGLSAPYISLLERDATIIPTIKTINKVAQVMNVSPDDIVNQLNSDTPADNKVKDIKETELLSMFRELSDARKEDILNFVKMIHSNEIK